MIIEDGTGTGKKQKVSQDNKAEVAAVTLTEEAYRNAKGDAYHLLFICSGILPNAPLIYVKNSDASKNLIVEGVEIHAECNAIITVVKNPTESTTILGAANTPVNVNVGAGITADGTFYTCMSGCISGLTGGTVMDRIYTCSGCGQTIKNFDCDIYLQKNQALMISTENATTYSGANIAGTIPIYFDTVV